ncbi:hypothetical protein AgCh_036036 [Apium graveolens]
MMNQRIEEMDGDSPLAEKRKQRLLNDDGDDRRRRRIGEVAGGATAECAVMCCCIPVAIINLLILAVYKVPAGLGKKVWRRKKTKKRRLLKKSEIVGDDFSEFFGASRIGLEGSGRVEFEDEEMWGELYGTGFWRVPSVKEGEEIVVELD